MKIWTIPRIPKAANQMLRAHWGARRRDLDSWREHVRRACGRCRRRVREKVRLNIVVYRQTRQDPDNAYASVKNLLDALVKEGWLADDSAELLDLRVTERVEARKVNHRTEVAWAPVGPGANGRAWRRALRASRRSRARGHRPCKPAVNLSFDLKWSE